MQYWELQVGDVVSLNSSDIKMTVEYIHHLKHYITCVWIDSGGKHSENFNAQSLIKYKTTLSTN